jgi:hypothetical protein
MLLFRRLVLDLDKNLGIAYCNENNLNKLFSNLESKGLNFTREDTFGFLGINFTKNLVNGRLTLTQKDRIQKINEATIMFNTNYVGTPAAQAALGSTLTDPHGKNLELPLHCWYDALPLY